LSLDDSGWQGPASESRSQLGPLQVNRWILIPPSDLEERFIRSPGPGGQNVNKLATAVQLRFDAARCPSLPEPVRQRLLGLAGRRLGADGFITIEAHRYRTRQRNRDDARERLARLILQATEEPKPRKPTRPSRAARERRMEEKRQRSQTKRRRAGAVPME
jgi:ribosome-associated protein